MKMRHIYTYLILILLTTIIYSCNESFLETKPLSIFTPQNVYIYKAGMDALLLSLRKNLRHDFYGSANELSNELITSDCVVSENKETSAIHNYFTELTLIDTVQNNFFSYWNNAYNQIRIAKV